MSFLSPLVLTIMSAELVWGGGQCCWKPPRAHYPQLLSCSYSEANCGNCLLPLPLGGLYLQLCHGSA